MLETKFAILLTALCLSVSGFANAEVLKAEAPVYVESVEVTDLEYSEVEYKSFVSVSDYSIEVALDTLTQEQNSHQRQSQLFIFANDSVSPAYKNLEVGWRFSV